MITKWNSIKALAVVTLCVTASACHFKPTAISFLDKVLTVDEFKRDAGVRKRVLDECHQNPGQLSKDPNCINATQAEVSNVLDDKPPRF